MSRKKEEQKGDEFKILKKFNKMSDRLVKNINLLNVKSENSNEDDVAINSYINENYFAGCDGNDNKDPECLNLMQKLNNASLTKKMDYLNIIHEKSVFDAKDVAGSNIISASTKGNDKNDKDNDENENEIEGEGDPDPLKFIEKINYASDRLTKKIDLLNVDTEKPIGDTIAESSKKLLDSNQSGSGEVDDDSELLKCFEKFNKASDHLSRSLNLLNERPECPDAYSYVDSSASEDDDLYYSDNDPDLLKLIDKFNNTSDCLTKKIDLLNTSDDDSYADAVESHVNETEGDDKNGDDDDEPEFLEFDDIFD